MQLEMEDILTFGAGKMEYWAGWKWSHPKELRPWIAGQVITPRWAEDYKSDDRIILDNGAFAAWRDNQPMGEEFHVSEVLRAGRLLRPEFVVLPDIVAGGDESLRRSRQSAPVIHSELPSSRLLVAVQEGMKIWEAMELADMFGGGIFVGGADYAWKRYAVETIRAKSKSMYVHVARIWKDGDLCWHSSRTQSFDNTTFGRGLNFNVKLDKVKSLQRYCTRFGELSPVDSCQDGGLRP